MGIKGRGSETKDLGSQHTRLVGKRRRKTRVRSQEAGRGGVSTFLEGRAPGDPLLTPSADPPPPLPGGGGGETARLGPRMQPPLGWSMGRAGYNGVPWLEAAGSGAPVSGEGGGREGSRTPGFPSQPPLPLVLGWGVSANRALTLGEGARSCYGQSGEGGNPMWGWGHTGWGGGGSLQSGRHLPTCPGRPPGRGRRSQRGREREERDETAEREDPPQIWSGELGRTTPPGWGVGFRAPPPLGSCHRAAPAMDLSNAPPTRSLGAGWPPSSAAPHSPRCPPPPCWPASPAAPAPTATAPAPGSTRPGRGAHSGGGRGHGVRGAPRTSPPTRGGLTCNWGRSQGRLSPGHRGWDKRWDLTCPLGCGQVGGRAHL